MLVVRLNDATQPTLNDAIDELTEILRYTQLSKSFVRLNDRKDLTFPSWVKLGFQFI